MPEALEARLKTHEPRRCDVHNKPTDPLIVPHLGVLDKYYNTRPAAIYRCLSERCEWERSEQLR